MPFRALEGLQNRHRLPQSARTLSGDCVLIAFVISYSSFHRRLPTRVIIIRGTLPVSLSHSFLQALGHLCEKGLKAGGGR